MHHYPLDYVAPFMGTRSVVDTGATYSDDSEPQGYEVAAFGPPRPARPEGANWVRSAGHLAMRAGNRPSALGHELPVVKS